MEGKSGILFRKIAVITFGPSDLFQAYVNTK